MRATFICEGTIVKSKDTGRIGTVIGLNLKRGVVAVAGDRGFWSELQSNIEVISYEEVE